MRWLLLNVRIVYELFEGRCFSALTFGSRSGSLTWLVAIARAIFPPNCAFQLENPGGRYGQCSSARTW
jgi:hypothetical protein